MYSVCADMSEFVCEDRIENKEGWDRNQMLVYLKKNIL